MEYIETTIGNLIRYIDFLEIEFNKNINESLEREDMLKSFAVSKRIINLIFEKFNLIPKNLFSHLEEMLNEIYTVLRKMHFSYNDFHTGSYLHRDKNFKLFKESCLRNEIYVRSLLSDLTNFNLEELMPQTKNENIENLQNSQNSETLQILQSSEDNSGKKKSKYLEKVVKSKKSKSKSTENLNLKQINYNSTFLLKISFQKNIPKSVENIFVNLVQYKDEVYYIKTNDLFGYFYFFRTNDGTWFWSPPKKTDSEDIWIQTPEIKIDTGFWTDKKIPNFIEQFIVWLEIFSPNIPEFYFEKVKEVVEEKKEVVKKIYLEVNEEKHANNMNILAEQMEKDKCIIY